MNMKRPLECLAGGFVLGEVLALLPVGWMAGILAACVAGVCYLMKKCGRSLIGWFLPVFCLWGFLWHRGDLWRVSRYERIAGEASVGEVEAEGTLAGIVERKGGSGLTLELAGVKISGGGREWKYGNVLVYLDGDGGSKTGREHLRQGEMKKKRAGGDARLRIGERIRVKGRLERPGGPGNPGEFDLVGYYHAIGIEGRFFAEEMERLCEGYSPCLDGIYRIKCRAGQILDRIYPQRDSGILKAMILGEKTELAEDIKKLYQSSGISHLLAISGLHISMIGLGCYGLLRKAGLGVKGAGAVGTAVTVGYGILAGGMGIASSVSRAAVMVLMRMWADGLGRTYDTRTSIAVSGMFLLLQSPQLLFQAGFQLSFGAVLALGIAEPLVERWLGARRGWQKTLLAGAVIQLATCPVVCFHSFEYPVYGMFLNLAVIPLMSCVLWSGILGVALGCVEIRAGMMAAGPGHYVLGLYQWLCANVQKLPAAVMVTGRPGAWQMAAYGAMWCGFLLAIAVKPGNGREEGRRAGEQTGEGGMEAKRRGRIGNRIRNMAWSRAAFAALFAGLSVGVLLFRSPERGMKVTFLDVGQGDGICIRTEEAVILVDGGSTDKKKLGAQVLEPFLKSQGIRQVDYAIVSHGDQDHISGLMELMEEDCGIRIRHVILPWLGRGGKDEVYEGIERAAGRHGAMTAWMRRGDRIAAGEMAIDCLYAGGEERGAGPEGEDRNEHSLMLRVSFGMAGILLTGDMSSKGEENWLEMGEKPRIQVLKVAHHGSSRSTEGEWLERIAPRWAVISCGRGNRYGHPGEDVLRRLEKQGAEWYATMDAGAVTVETDGRKMKVSHFSELSPPR